MNLTIPKVLRENLTLVMAHYLRIDKLVKFPVKLFNRKELN